MSDPAPYPAIPSPAERRALNAAFHATGAETGFWDDHGRPAPWPEDINEWTPEASQPITQQPDEQPF